MLNLSYTYFDQKSTGLDTGNSSLGGIAYNGFEPNHDYGQEGFVPKNRFVAYGVGLTSWTGKEIRVVVLQSS